MPKRRADVSSRVRAAGAQQYAEERSANWAERHKRVTFYCPVELLERLDGAVTPERSKSEIIVDALRSALG